MRNKILAVMGSALLLAACETGPDQSVNVGSTATPGTAEDFKLNIKDRVFFDTNKSHISAESKKSLEAQAGWLKTYANTNAVVEGHCDERGTREFNQALGARRAASSLKALVHLGIHKDRLKAVSYGKDKQPVAGTGEAVWAQNRTAITVIQ